MRSSKRRNISIFDVQLKNCCHFSESMLLFRAFFQRFCQIVIREFRTKDNWNCSRGILDRRKDYSHALYFGKYFACWSLWRAQSLWRNRRSVASSYGRFAQEFKEAYMRIHCPSTKMSSLRERGKMTNCGWIMKRNDVHLVTRILLYSEMIRKMREENERTFRWNNKICATA